jgi:hypothetical protein
MAYYTPSGPMSGPILWHDGLGPIDVQETPDGHRRIGTATPVGATAGGVATWQRTRGAGAGL